LLTIFDAESPVPSSTSAKPPSEPVKGNDVGPCGVARFSISIVPGMIWLRTVHL